MNPGTYDDLLGKYAGKAPDELRKLAERATAHGDFAVTQHQNTVAAQWYDVAFALDEMADGQEQRDKADAATYTAADVARLVKAARRVVARGEHWQTENSGAVQRLAAALAPFAEQDNA